MKFHWEICIRFVSPFSFFDISNSTFYEWICKWYKIVRHQFLSYFSRHFCVVLTKWQMLPLGKTPSFSCLLDVLIVSWPRECEMYMLKLWQPVWNFNGVVLWASESMYSPQVSDDCITNMVTNVASGLVESSAVNKSEKVEYSFKEMKCIEPMVIEDKQISQHSSILSSWIFST
jgi:hypothetical protein